MAKAKLIPPYGGKLVNLVVEGKEREELLARTSNLPSIKITMRNLCDLELLATGGFSPLTILHGQSRLRARAARNAAGGRDALAAPDHPDG